MTETFAQFLDRMADEHPDLEWTLNYYDTRARMIYGRKWLEISKEILDSGYIPYLRQYYVKVSEK